MVSTARTMLLNLSVAKVLLPCPCYYGLYAARLDRGMKFRSSWAAICLAAIPPISPPKAPSPTCPTQHLIPPSP